MVKRYIPKRGDIIHLNFNPQTGKEQKGKRPALVLSPQKYNKASGLILACPITSKIKNYPFEAKLPENIKTQGVVLSDQIKNLDWQTRKAKFIEKIPETSFSDVLEKIESLLRTP